MLDAPSTPRRSRRGRGGITLADVAKLAGVAPITASRALNHPQEVSPELLQRVREAVARTGYVPNMLAGGLASSRSRLVAAVVPTISGLVFLETLQSLTEALAEAGTQLMIGQSGYRGNREDALLDAIIGRRPDGIVLTGILHSADGRRRLLASGIPIVETWDLTPTPIDMLVGFSHTQVGAAVAERLHAKGRRCIGVLGGDDARARQREAGLVAKAAALGLAAPIPSVRCAAPTTARDGRAGLRALLAQASALDAVVCGSDALALGVLAEARALGLEVPGRLAVIGFGDLGFAAELEPPLSTVRIDGTAIGRHAARLILDRVEGRAMDAPVIDVGFTLVERGTT
jgi:LacI family gluconate utilization system Gnt-I transcriptional repressor